jgi:thiamine biosynthesis lipoprotein
MRAVPTPAGIAIDVDGARLRVPPGVRIDLGGIGKGLAADLVAEALVAAGAAGALVDVGGDLRATGASPDGEGWAVEVEDPLDPARTAVTLHFGDGGDVGVATSSTLGRRWSRADGSTAHHVVDAATGRSLDGPYVAATVVATRAWLADVGCKVVLAGDPWPLALGPVLPALAFDATGAVVELGGIDAWYASGGGCPT